MIFYDFKTTTHGKWILAGEHAVLRGHGAIVFPLKSRTLTLNYNPTQQALSAEYNGESGSELQLLFWSVLEHGMHLIGNSINTLNGHFQLSCNIPIGAGMGASAALCVATARWFAHQKLIDADNLLRFAQQLEDMFHGKSSGLDIAGVNSSKGIFFQHGQISPITPKWKPLLFLSSCEQIGMTSHCIQQVETLWNKSPAHAAKIDKSMSESVSQISSALASDDKEAPRTLAKAINQAADCFEQWGLINNSLNEHMQALRQAGAIAVKPTGSGHGGHVISLWREKPAHSALTLIPLY